MGVEVKLASAEQVRLSAPLAPNINHRETVFGGSAAALATLSAWALLHLRLQQTGLEARLVIQRSSMEYAKPIPGDFDAVCKFADPLAWRRFIEMLERHGRARLTLTSSVLYAEQEMAKFEGAFVAQCPPRRPAG
jgi:thioesterase domain-containing protein